MSPKEIDRAMSIYLGGPVDEGVIQIGLRDERLMQSYPADLAAIKVTLDRILVAVSEWNHSRIDDASSIYSWIASELPTLSETTRNKIAAYVIYNLEH